MAIENNAAGKLPEKKYKARALSVSQVINKKRIVYEFTGKFLESFGKPERNAIWIVWGQSGNGKTRFLLELTKYLTQFGNVFYNSFEEGDSESIARALHQTEMMDVEGKFRLVDMEPMDEFVERMERKWPQFGVVDSVQYSGIDYNYYKRMKERRRIRKKSLLFISHANGNNPDGNTADKIKYDAMIKIHVIGYVAYVRSRFGGNKPFIIWEEGAKKYWGKKYNAVKEGKYWPGQKK